MTVTQGGKKWQPWWSGDQKTFSCFVDNTYVFSNWELPMKGEGILTTTKCLEGLRLNFKLFQKKLKK